LLVAACVVPSSPILVTLIKEAPGSSETSVLTRATRHNNPEDTILHEVSYLHDILKLAPKKATLFSSTYPHFIFYFTYLWGWSETKSTITVTIIGPAPNYHYDCAAISRMNEWQEKLKYLEKTCPSTDLSTTDLT
jgi:hypothetical protein